MSIEAETAKNFVRYIAVSQSIFQYAALGVGTVEYYHFGVGNTDGIGFFYLFGNDVGFDSVCKTAKYGDRFAFGQVRIYFFGYLKTVFFYQRICRIYDILRRTVVLFEFEYFTVFETLLKVYNVVDIGSPKRIYALCIVAYDGYSVVCLRQHTDYTVLGYVRILVFVYQDEGKTILVFL